MAIELLDPRQTDAMRRAGRVARTVLLEVLERVRPGIATGQIDTWARERIAAAGARSSQLGHHGFSGAVCTSPNDVVCHGVPRRDVVVRDGDIINVDITTEFEGWHGDTSMTIALGDPPADARRVLTVARECLELGVSMVRPGVRIGDIGAAIEAHAAAHGCGSVAEYCGHGIGRRMHQPPQVVHVGPAGRGVRLRAGMCFTIEPMITIGRPGHRVLEDGWTVVTLDGSPSAQFEHTLLVTEEGVEVLTRDPDPRPRDTFERQALTN